MYDFAPVVLEVIDDGIGIPAEKVRSGKSLGIKGIKERVKQFNGAFKITSNKNKGSKLSITIPHNLNTK